MRHMFQRFGAMALAIAMLAGTVGTVSAQNTDTDSITASSTTVAALRITVTGGTVVFPALDAYGLNDTPAGIQECSSDDTSTTYATETPTVVNVISTTGYNVTSATSTGSTPGAEDLFVLYVDGPCGGTPWTFQEADDAAGNPGEPDPRISDIATDRDGTDYEFHVGAIIRVNEELTRTATLTFTMRASAVAPTTPSN